MLIGLHMPDSGFLPYVEARDFVRSLKISNYEEWRVYSKSGKKPKNIPAWPYGYYQNKGWKDWGDWLGTVTVSSSKRVFLSFSEARNYARKLEIKNKGEWMENSKSKKKPSNIPTAVDKLYCNDWNGWKDFFGRK